MTYGVKSLACSRSAKNTFLPWQPQVGPAAATEDRLSERMTPLAGQRLVRIGYLSYIAVMVGSSHLWKFGQAEFDFINDILAVSRPPTLLLQP